MSVEIFFFFVATVIIIVYAILSNVLLIYSILRNKKLRTPTSVFLCNLSMCDILFAGFIVPQSLYNIFHQKDLLEVKGNFCIFFLPFFGNRFFSVCLFFSRNKSVFLSNEINIYHSKCNFIS